MRRLLKLAGSILLAVVVAVVLALGGFRLWAMMRETATPEQAAGLGARFIAAGGLRIHYMQWGPDDGQPLLLVHGTASWGGTYEDIAAPLGKQGFRVIAPDMPPFGFSEKAPDGDYSRPASARRLLAFADALGLKHFVLGVHSYGGGPAIEAAFMQPERIDGLILLDVALGFGKTGPVAPPLAPLMRFGPLRNALTSATFTNPLMIAHGLRNFVYDDLIITSDRVALYARPSNVAGTTDAVGHWFVSGLFGDPAGTLSADLANYAAFKAPVLVIWGEKDQTTPLEQGEFIAKAFANAQLKVLSQVDHIPQIEKPFEVQQLIGEFLRSLPLPTAEAQALPMTLRGTLGE